MGKCNYCGNNAGWFSSQHVECRGRHDNALYELRRRALASAKGQLPIDQLKANLPGSDYYVQEHEVRRVLIQGFEDAVDSFLDDHIITEAEETQLAEYASNLNLSESERDRSGGQTRAVMGAVLRQVVEGEIPQRQKVEGNLPFNFQKSEERVWVFDGVTLYEERTRTRFEGGSTGVSVRVAKGVSPPKRLPGTPCVNN